MNPILEFHDVARSFTRGVPVLDGVTFSIGAGEVVGLLGRNGAGKTTLINIAMGMLYPHAGTVRVFGLSSTENPVEVKRRIGYVSEDQVFPPLATTGEVIDIHRHLFPAWDPALERQLMERFGLAAKRGKVRTLSKGQARQLALVCAVCHRPELLILDEPAGGLDPAARREFVETSIQLLNREGSAILFSSHHMADVERLGGRVVLLDDGRVLVDRELDQLREACFVVIVPRSAVADRSAFERVPGFIRARLVFDDWHVVVEGTADMVRQGMGAALGLHDVQCATLPLEELFIELVGGERTAVPA